MSTVDEELPETLPRWDIPSHWQWVSISDVGKVITGNTPPTKDESNYGHHIPFVKPPALTDKGIRSTPEGLSETGTQSSRTLPAGAVLVSCIGGLGKTGIAKVPVAFNQQINAIVFDRRVIPEFGFYYSQTLKPWLHGVASATTLPIVNKGKFQRAPFPLAPLDEQKLIVAEIEKQFSRLDEAVANLKRVKANLKRYKAAVLKAAVEGRLVETEADLARREDRSYETGTQLLQRSLNTRRSQWKGKGKYKEPVSPDTTDLAELPEGWVWATTAQLLREVKDGTHDTPKYHESGVPFITQKHVKAAGFVFEDFSRISLEDHEHFYKRSNPEKDDILVSMIGVNRGESCIVDTDETFSIKNVGLFKPDHAASSVKFIQFYLSSTLGQRLLLRGSKGGAQPFVGLTELRSWPIPVPPIGEQYRVVAEIDRRLSLIREVDNQVVANLKRAERLRQSILAKSFTGGDWSDTVADTPVSLHRRA